MSSCSNHHINQTCHQHHTDGCGQHAHANPGADCGFPWPPFPCFHPGFWPCARPEGACPFSRYVQPICCCAAQFANTARLTSAGTENGATLVIHKIVLEPCGNTTCTPRTYSIRITGPSYPCGETFQLRAGSCITLDEPLVITGLQPGTYCIEEIYACPNDYISTFTGPVCGREVTVSNGYFPTVVTIVSRKRLCRLCRGYGCGACSGCR